MSAPSPTGPEDSTGPGDLATVTVDVGGRIRVIARDDVRFAEACGDYVRLHHGSGSNLARLSLAALERAWAPHGFIRVHRRYLVPIARVRQARMPGGGPGSVVLDDGTEIPLSRRTGRELRERLAPYRG